MEVKNILKDRVLDYIEDDDLYDFLFLEKELLSLYQNLGYKMKFLTPLKEGIILKRYKRFLADIELPNGEVITAHTANTGSMKTCWEPG